MGALGSFSSASQKTYYIVTDLYMKYSAIQVEVIEAVGAVGIGI